MLLLLIILAYNGFALNNSAYAASPDVTIPSIGLTAVVVKDVTGLFDNNLRTLSAGTDVFQNEIIETDARSSTRIVFEDETVLTLGASSQLILDTMVYDPEANQGQVAVTLVTGVFRFVSGKLNSENYVINTPFSVIGIRGTVVDIYVDEINGASLVLRKGKADQKNSKGESELLDTPGTFTNVDADGNPPTKAAPVPQVLDTMLKTQLVDRINDAVGPAQMGSGTDDGLQMAVKAPNSHYEGFLAWDDPPLYMEIRDWYCAGDKLQDTATAQQLTTSIRALSSASATVAPATATDSDDTNRAFVDNQLNARTADRFKSLSTTAPHQVLGLQRSSSLQKKKMFDPAPGSSVGYSLYGCYSEGDLAKLKAAAEKATQNFNAGGGSAVIVPEGRQITIAVSRGTKPVPPPPPPPPCPNPPCQKGGGGEEGESEESELTPPQLIPTRRVMTGRSTPGDGYGAGKCADCRRAAFAACFAATAQPISEQIRDAHNNTGRLVGQMNALASSALPSATSAEWNEMNDQLEGLDQGKDDLQAQYDAAVMSCRQKAVEDCKDCGGGTGDDNQISMVDDYEEKIINCKGREVPFTNPARDNADEIWKSLFRDADGIPKNPTKEQYFAWRIALETDPRELFSRRDGVTHHKEYWPSKRYTVRTPGPSTITAGGSVYDNCCTWYSNSSTLIEEYTETKEVIVFEYDFYVNMTDMAGLEKQMSVYLGAAAEFMGGGAGASAGKLFKDAMAEAAAAGWLGNGEGAKLAAEMSGGDPDHVGEVGDVLGGVGEIEGLGEAGGKVGGVGDAIGQGTAAVNVGADAVEYLATATEGLLDMLDGELEVGVPRMTGAHHWSVRVKGQSFLELGTCDKLTNVWTESGSSIPIGVYPCSATTYQVGQMGQSADGSAGSIPENQTRTRDQQNSQARIPNYCFETEGSALAEILMASQIDGFDPYQEHDESSATGGGSYPITYQFVSDDAHFSVDSSGNLVYESSAPTNGFAIYNNSGSNVFWQVFGTFSTGASTPVAFNTTTTVTFTDSSTGNNYDITFSATTSAVTITSFTKQ